jgi:hypothetical protein
MPTLTAAGTKDFDAFKRANAKYDQGFTGYFDHYSHDGQHNYPFVNDDFRHKLLSQVDKSTDGFLADDWEFVCEDEEKCLLGSLIEEQKATCIDFIAEISCTDTDDFTSETTLFDELELDSLDVTEFFYLLKEEFEGDDDFGYQRE